MSRRLVVLTTMLALLACRPSTRSVEDHLKAGKARGSGTRVSLSPVAAGATRIYVFGPYTTMAQARRCMGSAAPNVLRGLESRDDVNVVVLRLPDGERKSVAVSRVARDFGPDAVERSYAASEAEFIVQRSGGWSRLVPTTAIATCI